jgi:hypothetical protein
VLADPRCNTLTRKLINWIGFEEHPYRIRHELGLFIIAALGHRNNRHPQEISGNVPGSGVVGSAVEDPCKRCNDSDGADDADGVVHGQAIKISQDITHAGSHSRGDGQRWREHGEDCDESTKHQSEDVDGQTKASKGELGVHGADTPAPVKQVNSD